MRWIDTQLIKESLPRKWREKAREKREKLYDVYNQEGLNQAKKFIKLKSSEKIWTDFFKSLPKLLKNKCWYCETIPKRSPKPVDHFRPKGGVDGDAEHEGYWWLAFDWENYRCACTRCNSLLKDEETGEALGKGSKFPLLNGSKRATCFEELELESPVLLDPTCPEDCELIWFTTKGVLIGRKDIKELDQFRLNKSIELLNLNHEEIIKDREDVFTDIKEILDEIQELMFDEGRNQKKIKKKKILLRQKVCKSKPLSRTAIVCLSYYKSEISEEILRKI